MIALCYDSTAGLGAADLAALPVPAQMVPLRILLGEEDRADEPAGTGTLTSAAGARLAAHMRAGGEVSTSMPQPGAFAEVYERLAAAGASAIVSVHISAAMSGTVDAARQAAAAAAVPVHIADAGITAAGLGAAVGYAARLAAGGAPAARVAAETGRWARESTLTVFVPETLEYLRRGGRIGRAAHLLGQMLQVHPLLGFEEGTVGALAKVRTRSKALERLCALVVAAGLEGSGDAGGTASTGADEAAQRWCASVQHLDAGSQAVELEGMLRAHAAAAGLPLTTRVEELSAVVAAHTGPGVLGVSLWPED
ncbi:DegV family protein [Sediminivirga luteola]|uniref:DegV domain-containing protein n=1 Tax=Sediminivirga luteola TaxID=1774748 RepID=A0A8J2TYT4_9MICO|nr:DegV family protein [Sediminivirga luteola]GGA17305.1 DegV domain-containing protein [Sediminivirga luteola]